MYPQQRIHNTRQFSRFMSNQPVLPSPSPRNNDMQCPSHYGLNNKPINSSLLNSTSPLSPVEMSRNTTQNWQSYRLPSLSAPNTFLSNQPSRNLNIDIEQSGNQIPKGNIMDYMASSGRQCLNF